MNSFTPRTPHVFDDCRGWTRGLRATSRSMGNPAGCSWIWKMAPTNPTRLAGSTSSPTHAPLTFLAQLHRVGFLVNRDQTQLSVFIPFLWRGANQNLLPGC